MFTVFELLTLYSVKLDIFTSFVQKLELHILCYLRLRAVSLLLENLRGKVAEHESRASGEAASSARGGRRKERLQWSHTTIVKLFDSSCLSQLRPFLNMIPDNSCFYFTPSHDQLVERMSLKIHISVKHFPAE